MNDFLQALEVQGRVINALLHREVRAQYGSTRLGYLWALITPMSSIAIFTGIFWSIGRADAFGNDLGSVAVFITTGFLSLNLFTNISTQVMNSNISNKALFRYPLVTPFDAMLARLILSTTTTLVSFIATLSLLYHFRLWLPNIDSLLGIISVILTVSALGFGVGLINSFLLLYFPSFAKIYSILTRPLLFTSGVFYLASDRFPPIILDVIYYNPILHSTEWLRSSFYKNWESNFVDHKYLFTFTVFTLFLGLLVQRTSQKRARE